MYILFSPRMSGWLSATAQYTSDRNDAKRFTRDDALERCRIHKDTRGLGLIPINLEDLEAI